VTPERTVGVYWTQIDGPNVRRTYSEINADGHHVITNKIDSPIHVVIRRDGAHAFAVTATLEVGQRCEFECLEGELSITIDSLRSGGSSH
jgi:hypothetical protein